MLRILFADDHALIREGLRPFLLQLDPETDIREASSLEEGLELFTSDAPPHLALLDLNMPGMDGIAGIKKTKTHFPDARVVILSGYYDNRVVKSAIDGGAHGFIPKIAFGKTMVSALSLVLAGETYVPTTMLRNEPQEVLPEADGALNLDGPWNKVTAREAEILRLVVQGKSNKEIGRLLGLNEVTVKGHLRNAYRKIGAGNRADAVRIAMQ